VVGRNKSQFNLGCWHVINIPTERIIDSGKETKTRIDWDQLRKGEREERDDLLQIDGQSFSRKCHQEPHSLPKRKEEDSQTAVNVVHCVARQRQRHTERAREDIEGNRQQSWNLFQEEANEFRCSWWTECSVKAAWNIQEKDTDREREREKCMTDEEILEIFHSRNRFGFWSSQSKICGCEQFSTAHIHNSDKDCDVVDLVSGTR